MDAKQKSYSAVRWSAASMAVKAGTAFLQVIIFARLLTPYEVGVVAMLLTVTNTVKLIADMGVSSAIISSPMPNENELNSLYWFNIATGMLLTLSLLWASGGISRFYNAPELYLMLVISSFYFVIWSVGQQCRVLAEKALSFATLGKIEIMSFSIGFIVTISLAYLSYGSISVAIGFVLTAIVNSIMCLFMLPFGAKLRLSFSYQEMKKYLGFGLAATATNIMNTLTIQSDVAITGRVFGPFQLGIYSQPRDLCLKLMFAINPIVTRVTFPLMSAHRSQPKKVYSIFLKVLRLTVSINFPLYGFIALYSQELTTILLGPTWIDSAPFMQLFAIWCAFRCVGNPTGSLLFAMGKSRRALATATFVSVFIFLSGVVAAQFGQWYIAATLIISYAALVPYFFYVVVRPTCGGNIFDYLSQLIWPALCTGAACIAAYLSSRSIDGELIKIAVGGVVGGVIYLAASVALNREWVITMLEFSGLKKIV